MIWCAEHAANGEEMDGSCYYKLAEGLRSDCRMVEALLIVKENVTREWRCWREDGSYHGPCDEAKIAWWKEQEKRGWYHRHMDCGWQLYIMENELDALASVGGDSQ